MRAVVVVESMFGNTLAVAEAVAAGLSESLPSVVVRVDDAPVRIADEVGLLVVGGPTHAVGMSRPSTRRLAAAQSDRPTTTAVGRGLREWLDEVELDRTGLLAATFDTRVAHPRLPGSAARRAERHLRHLGCRPVTPATTFWVDGTPGSLVEGRELDRARDWGRALAVRASAPTRHPGTHGRWPVAG